MDTEAPKRREFLLMMDKVSAFWKATFDNDPTYASSAYWNLFLNLWRKETPVKQSDAFTYMPELRSASGSKNYIDRAIEDGYIEVVGEHKDERTRYIQLTRKLREQLNRFFDDSIDQLIKAAEQIRKLANKD